MRRALSVVIIVIWGIVGGWGGYWIGHAAGWSENADWPGSIGGGTGAILLSICLAVVFAWMAGLAIYIIPEMRAKRVMRSGSSAEATVARVEKTGAQRRSRLHGGVERQFACDLTVHREDGPPYHARTTQFFSETMQAAIRPGARVTVRFDPAEPTRVAIVEPAAPVAG